jgi:uncharacterized membrane protein YphA (DoxX/SURF4 family)
MNSPTTSWSPAQTQALEYAWGEYRVWAATARQKKQEISHWRLRVLALTIIGALLGTASSQMAGLQATLAWLLGLAGGGCIALAAYLGRELLKPDQERHWVRARSLAEALKAETFLFRAGAPPYDAPDPAPRLLAEVRKLLDQAQDLPAASLTPDEKRQGLPAGPLSVGQYIEERVDDQIEHFYRPKAKAYEARMQRWRTVTLVIGGAAVLLGVLGQGTAAWVAVLTTLGTAVAAHVYANRYQYLVISYQATARQLESLKVEWNLMKADEKDRKRHKFLLDCEEAISIENSAWMAKHLEKPTV